MGSVGRRLHAGFVVLILLFLGYVVTQVVAGDRMQERRTARAQRLEEAHDANVAALQHMTDAETGVRGFQLTGHKDFLEPYDKGRVGAFTAFDRVATQSSDPEVLRLLKQERTAASQWLYSYATPIVNAGVADPEYPLTRRGKDLFDRIRADNAAVDNAIQALQTRTAAAGRREQRLSEVMFESLGVLLLVATMLLALWSRRMLLAPLDHIRRTLQRLAAGELSARAVPAGPAELRSVIGTLNHLAAETERLHTADRARLLRTDLRQAVAVALRDAGDPGATGRRVAAMIGEALGAGAVHGRVSLDATRSLSARWPQTVPSLSERTVHDVLAGEPGTFQIVPHVQGAVAVPLPGDSECPPGLLYVARHDDRPWSDDDRRLLVTLAREIDHAVRQRRLHDRQTRLIGELRALDERKDVFVSTVTHELRTPLTSILGYTEMLSDGDGGELSAMQQRGVSAILRNAHRLQATVADLLLLDKASGTIGRSPLAEPVPVDLAAVVTALHTEFVPVAEGRDITLTGSTAPAWVLGDPRRLERALRNLFDNAMKFTGAGGHATYRVAVDAGKAVLTVTDTGIGIPPGDLSGLFTPFHRAGNAMDQAVQGPGLGLAIVRTIMTEHGGTVTAQSQLDQGSTFTVMLPLIAVPVTA
ncbi:ATP-binding protein [Actinoplanes sp. TFC3]|uniref:ATP-binding protein n=1 Tax=Actinoplanes sp. TFC3 TaxID=1710355 RepID=UPI00082E84E3|nr:ATP-binding protein [Actinoplanes sp. TFC3]